MSVHTSPGWPTRNWHWSINQKLDICIAVLWERVIRFPRWNLFVHQEKVLERVINSDRNWYRQIDFELPKREWERFVEWVSDWWMIEREREIVCCSSLSVSDSTCHYQLRVCINWFLGTLPYHAHLSNCPIKFPQGNVQSQACSPGTSKLNLGQRPPKKLNLGHIPQKEKHS